MSWWQIAMLLLTIALLLVLLGVVNILSDISFKLGNVVASNKGIEQVQLRLGEISVRVERLEGIGNRIEDLVGLLGAKSDDLD